MDIQAKTNETKPQRLGRLLRDIPRGPTCKIINARMKQIFKMLHCYEFSDAELDLIEKEIYACKDRYEKNKRQYKTLLENVRRINDEYCSDSLPEVP